MQRLNHQISGSKTNHLVRTLIVRLGSRPDTKDLVAPIEAARLAYLTADDIWLATRAARVAATAELGYLDSVLDDAVFQLSRDALASVKGDRAAPAYRALFPITATAAMASSAGESQAHFVATLLSTLRANGALAGFASHADTIDAAQQTLEAALTARKTLYVSEATTRATRLVALDDLQRAYNLMHPRLQLLFPEDRTLITSFFPRP